MQDHTESVYYNCRTRHFRAGTEGDGKIGRLKSAPANQVATSTYEKHKLYSAENEVLPCQFVLAELLAASTEIRPICAECNIASRVCRKTRA